MNHGQPRIVTSWCHPQGFIQWGLKKDCCPPVFPKVVECLPVGAQCGVLFLYSQSLSRKSQSHPSPHSILYFLAIILRRSVQGNETKDRRKWSGEESGRQHLRTETGTQERWGSGGYRGTEPGESCKGKEWVQFSYQTNRNNILPWFLRRLGRLLLRQRLQVTSR